MELLSLKKMCEVVHVSRRSVQCYEKAGLLKPTSKNKYGHLLYDKEAVSRAEMIKFLQDMGFRLKEVKELIDVPKNVLKEALEKKVVELELEKESFEQLILQANDYIRSLE